MNERIKELYLQAHSIRRYDNDPALSGNPPTVYWQGEVSAQRFAELIVEECATAITDDELAKDCGTFLMDSWAKGMRYSAHLIKEHFGVKE